MVTEEILKSSNKIIDWEQRKYEVAKEIYCAKANVGMIDEYAKTIADHSIRLADTFIQQFKNH